MILQIQIYVDQYELFATFCVSMTLWSVFTIYFGHHSYQQFRLQSS